jgi:CheY-like chemotaxis protein
MPYKNILLIDDDEDDQEIFLTALEKIDGSIHCIAIDDARSALDMLASQQLHPEIIFLDLNMPVMNGQQFLLEVKQQDLLKDIPVIVLSTSSHTPTIRLAKELGAVDFISKPGNFEDLISMLRPIVGQ